MAADQLVLVLYTINSFYRFHAPFLQLLCGDVLSKHGRFSWHVLHEHALVPVEY